MIEIIDLHKHYGDFHAVKGINFKVEKGEILGLLGPNGAGKSSTIRMLCCYLTISSGNIKVNGLSVGENPKEVKNSIGYLPESAPLYYDMMAYDYLVYTARMKNVPEENIKDRISTIVDQCGLLEVMHKNIGELSKGYKQRVGLAHALIGNPEILVLDEPTSGLDPNQIIEIRQLIKEISKEKTIILCSHILPEIEATCDRVVIINKGEIVADGSIKELQQKDAIRKVDLEFISTTFDTVKTCLTQMEEIDENNIELKENVGEGVNIQIKYSSNEDIRDKIYEIVNQANLKMISCKLKEQSLEDLFRKVTKQES